MPYLLLVEAETLGAGKTTVASNAASQLRKQGFRVGGLLSLPVYEYRRDGAFPLVGQDALLLPGGERLGLARVGRPDWEFRNTYPNQLRVHPRLTEQRRLMNVDPKAANRCLDHLMVVLDDASVDAVVLDEVGTTLAGGSLRRHDDRLHEWCRKLPAANKDAAVVTVQLRRQHRQFLAACEEALQRMARTTPSDLLILDGLLPLPDLPPALLELKPSGGHR